MDQAKNDQQLDKALATYQAALPPKDYQAMFWAKAAQMRPRQGLMLPWLRVSVGVLTCALVVVVGMIIQQFFFDYQLAQLIEDQTPLIAQIDFIDNLDALESFVAVQDLDVLEQVNEAELS